MVWMDDWADFFFKFNTDAQPLRAVEDVHERLELRKELKCKSFKWYLETIWPQNFLPADDRFFGKVVLTSSIAVKREWSKLLKKRAIYDRESFIRSSNDHLNDYQQLIEEADHENHFCLNRPIADGLQSQPHGQAMLRRCENSSKNLLQQMFIFTKDGSIMTDENLCLDASEKIPDGKNRTMVRITTCTKTPRQLWTMNFKSLQLMHQTTDFCLTSVQKNQAEWELYSSPCKDSAIEFIWMFLPYPWK